MQFLLLNGAEDNYWKVILAEALEPLGPLDVARATQGLPLESREADRIIIIDATVVENVEKLVSSLRTESPERRIVVVTASPTWQRARAAFESGAIDYLPKTLQPQELRIAFEQILRRPIPPWPR
jgi:DNA-binding response OmpR family regulator